jgi:kinetochore protein NNF1
MMTFSARALLVFLSLFWLIPRNRPHTLSAEELHTAYLTPYLQQATTMLDTRLKNTQEDNKALMQRITDQRAEMESLVQGLEGVVADLEGSVEVLTAQKGGRGVNGLRAEVREMDTEIHASR